MDRIQLLCALDANYLPQLRVLLTSIRLNNPGETFGLYLMHSGLPECEQLPVFILFSGTDTNIAINFVHRWFLLTDRQTKDSAAQQSRDCSLSPNSSNRQHTSTAAT